LRDVPLIDRKKRLAKLLRQGHVRSGSTRPGVITTSRANNGLEDRVDDDATPMGVLRLCADVFAAYGVTLKAATSSSIQA